MAALLRYPLTWTIGAAVGCVSVLGAQATFSSRVEAVRVDVLVTEDGRPLRGLTPADFEVRDNGVLQTVDLASFEEIPLNVVLVLDMSASLQGLRLGHLQTAGRAILDGLRPDDRAALVTFSHIVTPTRGLSTDLEAVRLALADARGQGQTALVDAAYAGMLMGESDAGRSLVIVFSDGVDTASWLSPGDVLATARRSEVVVYGVEVGKPRNSFPRELSEVTGGRSFAIESTNDLSEAFSRILEEFRLRYLISYSPRGVPAHGWHELQVRVRKRGASVRARPGYFVAE